MLATPPPLECSCSGSAFDAGPIPDLPPRQCRPPCSRWPGGIGTGCSLDAGANHRVSRGGRRNEHQGLNKWGGAEAFVVGIPRPASPNEQATSVVRRQPWRVHRIRVIDSSPHNGYRARGVGHARGGGVQAGARDRPLRGGRRGRHQFEVMGARQCHHRASVPVRRCLEPPTTRRSYSACGSPTSASASSRCRTAQRCQAPRPTPFGSLHTSAHTSNMDPGAFSDEADGGD